MTPFLLRFIKNSNFPPVFMGITVSELVVREE